MVSHRKPFVIPAPSCPCGNGQWVTVAEEAENEHGCDPATVAHWKLGLCSVIIEPSTKNGNSPSSLVEPQWFKSSKRQFDSILSPFTPGPRFRSANECFDTTTTNIAAGIYRAEGQGSAILSASSSHVLS